MMNGRGNIRLINLEAFIVLSVLIIGLLLYTNSFKSTQPVNKNPVTTYIFASGNNAVSTECIRVQVFQKTWILNKDNFNLLAFNRNPLSVSRKAELKVSQYQFIRQNSHKIPQFILRYHLFPVETDAFPVLS
jgi:hypothetical protein